MSKRERIRLKRTINSSVLLYSLLRIPSTTMSQSNRKRSTALILLSTIGRFIVSSKKKKKEKKNYRRLIFIFIKFSPPKK